MSLAPGKRSLTGLHVLRSSDAHSWVEAYIPGYGWLELDPTPERPSIDSAWMMSLWRYWDAVQSAWMEWVVDYDMDQQIILAKAVRERTQSAVMSGALVLEKLQAAAKSVTDALKSLAGSASSPTLPPLAAVALALLALVLVGVRWLQRYLPRWRLRQGRAKPEDSSFAYLEALRLMESKGYSRREDQTAEEFADSISNPTLADRFRTLVKHYNRARFGHDSAAERQLPDLLAALRQTS